MKKVGWSSNRSSVKPVAEHPEVWEKVVRKLRARQMPPVGKPRPDDATYDAVVASLESVARPRGGRASESRPDGDHPAADPHRVSERHPRPAGARRRRRVAAAGRRVQLRLRQRDGRRSVADAARPLRLGGGEDQPARGRPSEPLAGRRDRPGARRTSRRRSTSTACPSARAAARSSTTRSRRTASTRSRSA